MTLSYDPYDYKLQDDPYPTYSRLREEAPVFYNEALDVFVLSRHADILRAFRDIDNFSNAMGVSVDPSAFGPEAYRTMSFLAMDPPRHTRLRSLVNRSFTPRRVAEMEARILEIADAHLAPCFEAGSFDFVSDFAGKMPMDVISEMMGVPEVDRAELRRLADLVLHREEGVYDVPPEGVAAALDLVVYYQQMVAERRVKPSEDMTSDLLFAEIDGDRLSDEEIISFLFLMVVAGNETTTKLLANAWYWAAKFPEVSASVLADSSRTAAWVEETLRFDGSTQQILRVTKTPLELHGSKIPSGSRVLLLIGSANRDPEVFPDPDRYDLDRDSSKFLSFGGGKHFCMGAPLARLEGLVGLNRLVESIASYEVDFAAAERVHSVNVRGFAALPTTVSLRENRPRGAFHG
ncbi:MAG: cytochrome P450 [Actinomycetes bacterium]